MDVRLPNGELIRNVPEGMSKADLVAKLRANGHDMSWVDGDAAPAAAAPTDAIAPAAEPTLSVGQHVKRIFGLGSDEEQKQAEKEYDTETGVPGVMKNLGHLGARSGARLVTGLTELPAAAATLPGTVAGSFPDSADALKDTSGTDIKRIFGFASDEEQKAAEEAYDKKKAGPHETPRSEAWGSATREFASPVTESRPIVATREWAQAKEKEAVAALTPEARRAIELSLVESDEDGMHIGEGATDPWWWTANVIDVGVQAAPGMGVTGMSARLAYAAKYRQVLGELAMQKIPQSIALKAAEKQALAAAARSAVISGGLTEGAVGGGQDGADVRATIESLDEETLMGYPGYLELREKGLSHEQAREKIASDKAAATAITTGTVIGLTGAPMNAFFGKLAAKLGREVPEAAVKTFAQRAAHVGEAVLGEGTQEFVQEGAEQAIQNQQLQPITKVGAWDNVLENAITGFTLGGVVGGGFALPSLKGAKKSATKDTAGKSTPADTDTVAPAAAAYEAADAALRKGMESARDPNVRMKYADLQALKDKHREAMVNYTRELMHAGMIAEKDQANVAAALAQAEAAGVAATPGKPAGGDISPARDVALEAVANAEQLEESDANDLIQRGYAKVGSAGNMVLTPTGRRARKEAQDRAEAEKIDTAAKPAAKPAAKVAKPKLAVPAEKQSVAQTRAAERKAQKAKPARELAAQKAAAAAKDADVLPATIEAKVGEDTQLGQELTQAGFETKNPQMREAFAAALDRSRRARSGLPTRGNAAFRLKGQPETAEIPGQGKVKIEPVTQAKEAAAAYRQSKGITAPEQTEFAHVDPKKAKRIALAFEQMKHEPNNPVVKRAYRSMIDETKAQWQQIKKTGLKVEFIKPGTADPYAKSPRMAIEDVRKNNHLWVFPTDSGFGSDSKYTKDNPMLEDSGEEVGGHKLKNNDVFRIVHDYFGHVQEANGFRADGEENAWRIHAGMYSPAARRAMTTETRGQNSWVNYGPHGEKNRTASGSDTVYADQKIGLLPAEHSAFPGETLNFKHFSKESSDQLDLDPEKMGTGAKGAEAKRGGPKVVSLYAEHGETEPDVSNGKTRYNVAIPKEDLYDGSADPQGLLKAAQVPYGMTTDAQGNTVPVGTRFDMNKFEESVRDAGYLGYHLPEAQGILKGQARIFQTYPATREGFDPDKAIAAMRTKQKAKRADVERLLTDEERGRLRDSTAKRLVEIFNELPDGAEFASSALAGQAKRGWYRRSAEALSNVFGADAPRFAALLAALSPQTSVEWNFRNAVATWVGWDKAGRPTDRKAILDVMKANMFPNTARVGQANILPAWINNTVRALTSEDPSNITLSGPKVDSFAANLRGETERVTLDAWMANWAGVQQTLFSGSMNKAGDSPGMRPGYLAYAARVREAAEILSKRTGETWTPAEVQETVWSWAKTLYEQAESYGALGTAREILDNKELTDELINATPDFAGLFEDPSVASSLSGTVYAARAQRGADASRVAGAQGKATPVADQDLGRLRKAADRLDALRDKRAADEAATRAESAEDIAFRVSDITDAREKRKLNAFHKGFMENVRNRAQAHMDQLKSMEDEGLFMFNEGDRVFGHTKSTPITIKGRTTIEYKPGRIAKLPAATLAIMPQELQDASDTGATVPGYFIEQDLGGEFGIVRTTMPQWGIAGKYGAPRAALRTGSGRGIDRAKLDSVAARVKAELGVTANIAETQNDLPEHLRDLIPEGSTVTGMFYEDPYTDEQEIWYVRENLDDANEAYENALHEAVGHMGLRAVLGTNYHKVMETIRASFPEKVQWAANQNQIDMNHPDPATRRRLQSLAAEELVAYAAGKVLQKRGALSEQSVWRKIIAKVRDILRGVGFLNNYSGADIEALIYRARDYFRKDAKSRAEEIKYRGDMESAARKQPDDAAQWLDANDYLRLDGEEITLEGGTLQDFDPGYRYGEKKGKPPIAAVDEQITFSPGFNETLRGEDIDGADLNFGEVSAFADGQKIGYVTIAPADVDRDGWTATYVYVNPRYRGKGVAQRMYKAVSAKLGVKPRPSDVRTPNGRGMWESFNRRGVAFRMKEAIKRQIDSPEFKEWFGKSKVVDENNEPLKLFHGTFGDFNEFAQRNANSQSFVGPGFYFTDNPHDASENYASLDGPDISYRVGNAHYEETEGLSYQMAIQSLQDRRNAIDDQLRRADEEGNYKEVRLSLKDEFEELAADERELDERTTARARKKVGHVNEGSVMPMFMRMENPFRLGGDNEFKVDMDDADAIDDIMVALQERGLKKAAAQVQERLDISESIDAEQLLDILKAADEYDNKLIPEVLARLGHDGIIDEGVGRWGFTPFGSTHYITWRSENVKSAVGNNGAFDRSDPRVAFAFKQGPTGNSNLDSFIQKIGANPKTFRQRWDEFKADLKDRTIMGLFDEFHGIFRAGELAGINAGDSGYIDARLSKNSAELTQTIIEHGPPIWDDGAPNVGQGMGLLQILKPLKGNTNLWLAYMTARRADRLMTEGRENLFNANEIAAALDLARQHPEFDIARAQYNKLQTQVLDFAEQAGVISAQGRALWEHADYIPFHRVIEGGQVKASANGGQGIGFVRNQIKKLTGGKQKIGDPLENIVRNWLALMDASLKANAGRTTVDALNGTGLVTPYKGAAPAAPIVPFSAAKQFLAANPQLAQTLSAIGLNPAMLTPQAFAGLQQMVAQTGPIEDDVISIWRNGKKENWKVHDPLLMRSLSNINSKAWAPIIKILTYPKRIVTKGITLTPQFMLKNFWRDIWHVFVQGARSSTGAKITVLPSDSLRGLISTLRNDDTAKGLLAGGGSFTEGYVNPGDLSGAAKVVRRSLNKGKVRGVVLDGPMKVWHFYRNLQNAAENANRVAMYNKARAAGQSRKEAVFAARDLLDFSMRGNNPVAQLIVMSTPFMNARLQGLYRLGTALKQDFVSVAMRGMLITLATAALLARNWDDDRYKELTDEQKANYWHFFDVFQKGDHFQLPKPFEVGTIFGSIPEAIGDAMFTNAEDPDGTLQSAKYVGYMFGQTLNLTPQPQAVWPLLELATNKDSFTGSPILTQGDESVLPEDQRGPRSSPTYAAIADMMPDGAPEALRSPKQLEHLGRGYLGNLQDYVLLASDAMIREAKGEAAPPERATQDLPGVRDFYKSPGPARGTRQGTLMYELASEAAKVQASIKRNEEAETDEGDARAEKLDTDNAALLDVADDFKKAAKSVTDLKKEQRQIQLDPAMTPAEKRTEIDAIQQDINDIAKDVYDLRPGGKLNPDVGAELLIVPPAARATILRKNNMPATADLLEQLA